MVSFHIPATEGRTVDVTLGSGPVLFAGSRHITPEGQTCRDLVTIFGTLGVSFLTGCAGGVDAAFRRAFRLSKHSEQSLVACAFKERVKMMDGLFVVPDNLPPRVALAKRTLWMTERCSLLILFPSDPIGKGSNLAFKSTIMHNKPVFMVQDHKPPSSDLYSTHRTGLFGIVEGWWCLPPVYAETGLCYEEV